MLAGHLIGLGAHAEGDFADAAPRLRVALDLAEELGDDAAGEPLWRCSSRGGPPSTSATIRRRTGPTGRRRLGRARAARSAS